MINIRPFRQLIPGGNISASEINRALEQVESNVRFDVAAPLRWIQSSTNGKLLGIDDNSGIWVRITGHEKNGIGHDYHIDSHYSGIQQADNPNIAGSFDQPGGMNFFVDDVFLKEAGNNSSVGDGAIVRAYPSTSGSYWVFTAGGSGGSSAGVQMIRITGEPVYDGINVKAHYPGIIQSYDPFFMMPGPYRDTAAIITITFEDMTVADANCWVINWFDYTDDSGNDITIGRDGNAGRIARDTGKDYNPTGDLGAPAMRVYDTSQYASDIKEKCNNDGTVGGVLGG